MARAADKPVMLSQAQAEAIGRLQLIQLVGLEIERLVNEYKQVAEEIEGYEAHPRRRVGDRWTSSAKTRSR